MVFLPSLLFILFLRLANSFQLQTYAKNRGVGGSPELSYKLSRSSSYIVGAPALSTSFFIFHLPLEFPNHSPLALHLVLFGSTLSQFLLLPPSGADSHGTRTHPRGHSPIRRRTLKGGKKRNSPSLQGSLERAKLDVIDQSGSQSHALLSPNIWFSRPHRKQIASFVVHLMQFTVDRSHLCEKADARSLMDFCGQRIRV